MSDVPDGLLLALYSDGQHLYIPNTYDAITMAVDAIMDFTRINDLVGFYVADDAHGLALNVTASFFAGRPIYGHAVVVQADTDDEGGTLPGDPQAYWAMVRFAKVWRHVVVQASRLGQDLTALCDADNFPPPEIISIEQVDTFEDFLRATGGDAGEEGTGRAQA